MGDETLKNQTNMLDMILVGVRVDQYIINIYDDPAIQHVSKHIIDECLEHRQTIGQPERHDKIFVVS